MAVITVSRAYGLYIEDHMDKFAEKNGYDVFSQEILAEVAKSIGQPIEKVRDIYSMDTFSSFKIFLSEILNTITEGSSVMVTGSQLDAPVFFPLFFPASGDYDLPETGRSKTSYLELMKRVINDLYEKGNVIIIGRGAQIILKDRPDVLNIRFEGDDEMKIRRVMSREGLNSQDAADRIKKVEKRRHDYIDYFYGKKVDSPELYDIIINIDRVRPAVIDSIILDCLGG